MKPPPARTIGSLALVALLALWPAPGTAAAADKVTIASAAPPGTIIFLQLDLAGALGFFTEEGLEVEMQYLRGGGQTASALIGGTVDFATGGADPTIRAQLQGKELRLIVSFSDVPALTLLVGQKYAGVIKSPRDLRGRTLGVTSPGSATHMILNYILTKNGIRPDEATIIGVGTSTFPPALENDKIQAGMTADPFTAYVLKRGTGFALIDLNTDRATRELFGGPYQSAGLLTRGDVIQKRPEVVQKVVSAIVKTNRWIAGQSREEILKALPPGLVKDRQLFLDALEHSRETFSPDGRVHRESIETVIRVDRASGQLPGDARVDVQGLFDPRFAERGSAASK